MSDSNNNRDPFTDNPEDHATITNLVQRAVQTHRQPQASTRKRFPSEETRSKITLDLDPDTIAALREIAREMGVKKRLSALAQALMDYALEAYQSGRIVLELRPSPIGICFEAVEANDNES
jgi:LmbE family N-acetylglucosaminyl deacetylase